ncbi:MAG: hypothetical protein JSR80_06475 [Verrucomicrobia bacterium]|nr:hypothetical protein [Verrucomicrobiota bacterium]
MEEITLLLTGLFDEPLEDLGGLTPYEVAYHATLDWMESEGRVVPFFPPDNKGESGSLISLWGAQGEAAEGPLWAKARGIALEGKSAYCGRFVAAGQGTIVDVADELVSGAEGAHLCSLLSGEGVTFCHLQGPLFVLLVSGSPSHTPLLSPSEMVGRLWVELLPSGLERQISSRMAVLTEDELNELRLEMGQEPINALYLWGGGDGITLHAPQRLAATLCTSRPLLQGAALALNMKLGAAPPSALLESLTFLKQLDQTGSLYLDLPYLWQSTYKGDLREKIKRIEWLDRQFIAPLLDACVGKKRLRVMPLCRTSMRLGKVLPGGVRQICFP